MNHFAIHLKLTPYCKSTILQLKKINEEQGMLASWRKREQMQTQKPLALSEKGKHSSLEYDSPQKSLERWPA